MAENKPTVSNHKLSTEYINTLVGRPEIQIVEFLIGALERYAESDGRPTTTTIEALEIDKSTIHNVEVDINTAGSYAARLRIKVAELKLSERMLESANAVSTSVTKYKKGGSVQDQSIQGHLEKAISYLDRVTQTTSRLQGDSAMLEQAHNLLGIYAWTVPDGDSSPHFEKGGEAGLANLKALQESDAASREKTAASFFAVITSRGALSSRSIQSALSRIATGFTEKVPSSIRDKVSKAWGAASPKVSSMKDSAVKTIRNRTSSKPESPKTPRL